MRFAGWILTAAWLTAGAAGSWFLWSYADAPGGDAGAAEWPREAGLSLDRVRPTVVLFVHPRCACTRASLNELARVLSARSGRASLRALFYRPIRAGAGWERGELWDDAARLGFEPRSDPGGRTAASFGARTSGFVAIYAPSGRALYRGGVTLARGHEGDNMGAAAVADALDGRAGTKEGPVFGCLLRRAGGI